MVEGRGPPLGQKGGNKRPKFRRGLRLEPPNCGGKLGEKKTHLGPTGQKPPILTLIGFPFGPVPSTPQNGPRPYGRGIEAEYVRGI